MILALDIATTTGWAAMIPNDIGMYPSLASGSVNLYPNLTRDFRYIFCATLHMLSTIERRFNTPDLIAFEEVKFHKGWKAAKRYWTLLGAVEAWTVSDGHFVTMLPLSIADIKIHATGKGNAKKDDMMAAARERGWTFKDDNEADALWILDLARKRIREGE